MSPEHEGRVRLLPLLSCSHPRGPALPGWDEAALSPSRAEEKLSSSRIPPRAPGAVHTRVLRLTQRGKAVAGNTHSGRFLASRQAPAPAPTPTRQGWTPARLVTDMAPGREGTSGPEKPRSRGKRPQGQQGHRDPPLEAGGGTGCSVCFYKSHGLIFLCFRKMQSIKTMIAGILALRPRLSQQRCQP